MQASSSASGIAFSAYRDRFAPIVHVDAEAFKSRSIYYATTEPEPDEKGLEKSRPKGCVRFG
jgi:hypothetical protein